MASAAVAGKRAWRDCVRSRRSEDAGLTSSNPADRPTGNVEPTGLYPVPSRRQSAGRDVPATHRFERLVLRGLARESDGHRNWYKSRHPSQSALRRRSEEHTSELQSHVNLVCRLLLEK